MKNLFGLILLACVMSSFAGNIMHALDDTEKRKKGAPSRNHAGMEPSLFWAGAIALNCRRGGQDDESDATAPEAPPDNDSFPTDEDIDAAAEQIAGEWMEHLGPFLIGQSPGVARDSLIELLASGMAQQRLMDERSEDLANEIQDHFYSGEENDTD